LKKKNEILNDEFKKDLVHQLILTGDEEERHKRCEQWIGGKGAV